MEREAYDLMHRQETSHWWFVGRRNIIADLITSRIRPAPGARILEAGCGTGGNLPLLMKFGHVSALEYDDDARELAKCRSGIAVAPGALPGNIPFADAGFDVIALLDVLEHLDEDVASLEALKAKLSPQGKLLITVPAAPWLWSDHDLIHHHKRRYTIAGMKEVLSLAGFSNVDIGYFNCLLFPLAVIERISKKLGIRQKSSSDDVGPILNRVFAKVFSTEVPLLRGISFPFGLSIYAIASPNS